MDLAYDHIAEQTYGDRNQTPTPGKSASQSDATTTDDTKQDAPTSPTRQSLQSELQETYKAFSTSTWGVKLGGFWGSVKKQGEDFYEEARKEVGDLGTDALKEIEGLRNKVVEVTSRPRSNTVRADEAQTSDKELSTGETTLQENETFIERFKSEAAKRLKEVQKAEDAADEALLRFGTNIRNFLKDAIAVTAPEPSSTDPTASTEVLFESKDAATGKRVVHASRFEAQLHVIHTSPAGFTQDPDEDGDQWVDFKTKFDIEKNTEDIAQDLEKYTELRSMMETLVPEKVEFKDFWTRYYFLRHVIEKQEEKRREMLKASSTNDEEQVGWGEDSEDEEEPTTTTTTTQTKNTSDKPSTQHANDSTTTLQQPTAVHLLKPAEPRRSHDEKSVVSDASYDLVSGTASRAPSSPKDKKIDDSDEEDWE